MRPVAMNIGPILIALAMAMGLMVTYILSGMISQSKEVLAAIVGLGLGAAVGSLLSLEFALAALLAVAFTDGFLKGMDPTKYSVFVKDFFLMLALARWGWLNLMRRDWPSLRLPLTIPFLLFALYCTMQVFNTATASWLIAFAGLRSWIIWIPIAFLTYELVTDETRLRRLMLYVLVLALGTGIYGIIQYNIGFEHLVRLSPGFDFYNRFGWGERHVRAVSTFVGPGAFGAAMSLCAIVAFAGAAYFRQQGWRLIAILTTAVCLVGLFASASRAPLLGLVVGAITGLVLVRRPQFLIMAALVALPTLWVLNSYAGGAFEARYNPQMINRFVVLSRIRIPLETGIRAVIESPLGRGVATGAGVGRGLMVVGEEELRVSHEAAGMVENEYGRALKELGVPGVLLFLWLLWKVVQGNLRSYRLCRSPRYRMLAGACVGITMSMLAQLLVGSALYIVPGGIIFWMFYGLSMRLPELEKVARTEPEQVAQPPPRRLYPAAVGGRW